MLAKAVCQSLNVRLIHGFRGQARSHIVDRHSPLAVEFFQEHGHLFFGLFVAMGLGGFYALLPRQPRRSTIPQPLMRLPQQLPRR